MDFCQPVELLLAEQPPFLQRPDDKRADRRRCKFDILRPLELQIACLVLTDRARVDEPGQHHAKPTLHHRQRRTGA